MLLGVAEAGFFPGIIYYLSDWFPARVRARAVAHFMVGGVIASMVGNPLSGFILQSMDQVGGLVGLAMGLPARRAARRGPGFRHARVPDRPPRAGPLADPRGANLARPANRRTTATTCRTAAAIRSAPRFVDPRVWLLIAVYFTVAMGDNSYGFYIPTFLRSQFPDWSPFQIGLLAAVPSVVAMVGMVLVGRHSDRTGERRWHVAGSAFTAALGWLLIALAASGSVGDPRSRFALALRRRRGRDAHGHEEHVADVLDAAPDVPHRRRGRGRHRPDQFRRQPRRHAGAEDHRPREDGHRQFHRGLPRHGRDLVHRRPARLEGEEPNSCDTARGAP